MKILSVIIKSFREQIRSFWILVLTLLMGPFFIFIYFLITESSKPQYKILITNFDKSITSGSTEVSYGRNMIKYFRKFAAGSTLIPIIIQEEPDQTSATDLVKKKKADALIIIGESFSADIEKRKLNDASAIPTVELQGDLTDANYIVTAVWAGEMIYEYSLEALNSKRIFTLKETALGSSASINSFNMSVPGILILSLIMLMFTASIAFVAEVENRTIIRLKMSKISAFEFLTGVTAVQLLVGIASVLVTLLTAILLGFHYKGSLMVMIFVACLASLSIISFSLIIAAVTKSATEVLVVGNFPMFLFMFFTGAAFPLKSHTLFTVAGYPLSLPGLMTPTHAISALNKTLVMNMDFTSIIPEIVSILILTALYFLAGAVLFSKRHLRLS